ncbi:MAG: hypothetical protein U0169_04975 [Polyangiaceae bacterium]
MRLLVALFERFYVLPRERRLGRALGRLERVRGALLVTSPLWLFVIVALVRNGLRGTLHW